jgi:hypothetical protein
MTFKLIVGTVGVSVMTISFMTLLGYWINEIGLYRWYGDIGMAFNTAICFWLVGLALVFIATYRKNI